VALLSDALFFTQVVPIGAAEAAGSPEPGGAAAQVELALEALSPFSLAQLYWGYFRPSGSSRALVFAAYRRRFTSEQVAAWQGVELVLPAFAALLGGTVAPGTTAVVAAPDGLTAIRWGRDAVPDQVHFLPLPPEASEDDRARVRAELLRTVGSGGIVVDLTAPDAQAARSNREIVFRSGSFESRLPTAQAAELDVRDKADLSALRRARARDAFLWRVAAGSILMFGLLAFLEIGLFAGGFYQKALKLKLNAQAPEVARITTAQNLAHRIDELSTQRLLPLEMVSIVSAKKPESVQFFRAVANDRNSLTVDAQTNNPGEISGYKTALEATPECAKVEIHDQRTRNNIASFTLVVTFKPGALKPAVHT
jgi:hypothetical protein